MNSGQSERLSVLLVVQPSVSHYRAPFVRALLDQDKIDFELVGRVNRGARTTSDAAAADDALLDQVKVIRRRVLFKNLHWDAGLVTLVRRTPADAIVLEGNVYALSNWVSVLVARFRRRKVIFWGHGWKRPESGPKLWLRRMFYARGDGHLTYGDGARTFAASVGLDASTFFPVYNSIYSRADVAADVGRRPRAAGTLRLIYSGRLTPRHRTEDAIRAVQTATREGVATRLVVVGDGAEKERLEQIADGASNIVFYGAEYDRETLRRLYAEADFSVSPGASGLNIIQSLGFGVPVIAADGDPQSGPEIEAVRDDDTGLMFEHARGVAGLTATLRRAAALSDEEYERMSMRGRELVLDRYNAEAHASALASALTRLTGPRRTNAPRDPAGRHR